MRGRGTNNRLLAFNDVTELWQKDVPSSAMHWRALFAIERKGGAECAGDFGYKRVGDGSLVLYVPTSTLEALVKRGLVSRGGVRFTLTALGELALGWVKGDDLG